MKVVISALLTALLTACVPSNHVCLEEETYIHWQYTSIGSTFALIPIELSHCVRWAEEKRQ